MTPDTTPARTWDDFRRRWAGPHNFLLEGACAPFDFDFPPIDQVIAELAADEQARVTCGHKGGSLDMVDYREHFRSLPLEKAMEEPFSLAHFKLSNLDAPGKFLHGFGQRVLEPWKQTFTAAGFTFDRCYPIIFISGRDSATNYHMDLSHVLAWQIYGTKRFCGLKDPDRWAPKDMRLNYKPGPGNCDRPDDLTEDDELCHMMPPGAALWNVLLTPHWVDSVGDEIAMSVNFSHGGVRLNGQLSPNEAEVEAYREADPEHAPKRVRSTY